MAVLRKSKQAPNIWHLGYSVSSWSDFTWKGTGLGRLEIVKRIGMQWHCSWEAIRRTAAFKTPAAPRLKESASTTRW